MKHLLIILSLLLLSSPVIGDNHKGETLYRWGKYPENVWKGFGEKETHPVYKGDIENGVPNGLGVVIHPDGGKYEGEFKDGKNHGQGTFTSFWVIYEGEFKDGKIHQGTETFLNGEKYVGEFKDGKRHGQGTHTFGKGKWEGDKYEGEWKDGYRHGQGTYTSSNGDKYVGEWKDGGMWNGIRYDKEGNIKIKIVNGDWIEQ